MKKILFTIALLACFSAARAQFVVSLQLGGNYYKGGVASESLYEGPNPLTGNDTIIRDNWDTHYDTPLTLTAGFKFGYQYNKFQFGLAGSFSYYHVSGEQTQQTYLANNPNTIDIDARPVDSLIATFDDTRTGFSIAPYLRRDLIVLGDVTFFAELNAYFTKVNNGKHHDFLDWYKYEMHHTIDTSFEVPLSSVSLGLKITPGLSWHLAPSCYVDLYFDVLSFAFDRTIISQRTVIDEYDTTTEPRVLGRRTTIDVTSTTDQIGFALSGSPLLQSRNWVRVGFNYTF